MIMFWLFSFISSRSGQTNPIVCRNHHNWRSSTYYYHLQFCHHHATVKGVRTCPTNNNKNVLSSHGGTIFSSLSTTASSSSSSSSSSSPLLKEETCTDTNNTTSTCSNNDTSTPLKFLDDENSILMEVTRSRENNDNNNNNNNYRQNQDWLAASKLGLDPTKNRFHQPIVYHENYSFANWPGSHTFPMDKFARLAHALMTTCRKSLPEESNLSRPIVRHPHHFFRPLDVHRIPRAWFFTQPPPSLVSTAFLDSFLSGTLSHEQARTIGFREQTSRPELIERTLLEVAGTILACQLALKYGIATNAAGGTHHAHPNGGAGYTILNDLAIAANVITNPNLNGYSSSGNIQKVLVIDCDVHQGDGTAKFSESGPLKDKLFTLSFHCASNYPHPKAHSTLDVGLPDRMKDEEYLQVLIENVNHAIEEVNPDFVLYDAGVDIYEKDTLGRLNISENGIRRRDRWVLERCVSAGIPVVGVIGGGYDKNVDALARRHAIVHEEAAYIWRKYKLWTR